MKKLALLIGVVCSMSVQADYKIIMNSGKIKLPENSVAESGLNCLDILEKNPSSQDGVYTINPTGNDEFEVYCDMTTDGGGWTVFQKRFNGSVDFYKDWDSYKNGFGSVSGEYWLGNDKIYDLTKDGVVLRIDLKEDNIGKYATYSNFMVSNEINKYKMTLGGFNGGTLNDSFSYHAGQYFSTFDRDTDNNNQSFSYCSIYYKGAWWYNSCYYSNLNGEYGNESTKGNTWSGFTSGKSTDESVMMIR